MLVGTDGSCLRNRPGGGPTGWAYTFGSHEWKAGGLLRGTNQVGELMAVLMLLRDHADKDLRIQTDSAYVIGVCTQWKKSWQRKRYWKNESEQFSNLNIIIPIHHLLDSSSRSIEFIKVPGHDKQNRFPLNTHADKLAKRAAVKAKEAQNEVLFTS